VCLPEVSVESRVATGSSGLFSVESELSLKVVKEDQGSEFYCEVNYQVIGGFGMLESEKKKIRVRCEYSSCRYQILLFNL
jgi:preprotein translocase subunit SecB